MLRYLIEKEFKQFLRNPFLPRLVVVFPVMIMFIMPWVATLDIRDVNVTVVDNDRSPTSQRLIGKIGASTYFNLRAASPTYDDAFALLEYGRVDLILEIPRGFERNIARGEGTDVLIAVNAVNGTKGSLGGSYMSAIVSGFGAEMAADRGFSAPQQVALSVQNLYNPTLNYRFFMIPALVAILIILLCGFFPALNIVGEKEAGTIEQINVTPVGKLQFILAKLIPYWAMGLVVLTLAFLIAWLVYGLVPAGSFAAIYTVTAVFILAMSGFGLLVSTFSQTMQQAMFVMFFFMMIFMLMSGLFTPVRSMPDWAQWISACAPPRYFVEAMRGVYLKGSTLTTLWPQLAALAGFALLFNALAIASYRKRS